MNKASKRRRRVSISRREALRRIEKGVEISETNLQIALSISAALEAGNEFVKATEDKPPFYGAQCYNTIKRSLSIDLALTACRLFDAGAKRYRVNSRDAASLPALIRLLRQRRCKLLLQDRARYWIPGFSETNLNDCRNAIDRATDAYKIGRNSSKGVKAYASLREFRDRVVAHSLLDKRPRRHPKYEELFYLVAVASKVVEQATLAVYGRNIEFAGFAQEYRRDSDTFWRAALPAAISLGKLSSH